MRQVIRLLTTIMSICFFMGQAIPAGAAGDPPGTISVSGEAVVKVAPDEVVITLGVESYHARLSAAKRENDARVERVLRLAQGFDIEPKHIQTDFISIEPHYHDGLWREKMEGYFVRKSIVVTLRDLSQFDRFLTEVIDQGVNYIHGIEFRTTELRDFRDQARALAVRAAREKAEAMAGELGIMIGDPQSIREESIGWWSGYGASWWGYRGGGLSQNVLQNLGEGPGELTGTIAPGQIAIRGRVSVTFYLQ